MADPEVVSASMAVIAQGLSAYASACPDVKDVRRARATDPDAARDLRAGEIVAGGSVLIVGGVATALTRNPTPLVVAMLIVTAQVLMYEWTLALPPATSPA